MAAGNSIVTPLAIVGYFLTIVGYFTRVLQDMPKFNIIVGMILVTAGYTFLLLSSLRRLREEAEEQEVKKKEGFVSEEARDAIQSKPMNSKVFAKIGYALLFAFFGLIIVFPALTYTVRFYDPFAAAGYGMLAIGEGFVPAFLPYVLITMYYIFGSYVKIEEEGMVNKLQLVSRSMLAVYYGLSMMGIH